MDTAAAPVADQPNWIFHASNVWDFCVSTWRFHVMKTLRERRLMREHTAAGTKLPPAASATSPARRTRARPPAPAAAPILVHDSDSEDEGVEHVLLFASPPGGAAGDWRLLLWHQRVALGQRWRIGRGGGGSGGGSRGRGGRHAHGRGGGRGRHQPGGGPVRLAPRGSGPGAPVAALLLRDPGVRAPPVLDPDDTDGLFLPFLLEKQVLSSAQLHSVALAMKAFERGRAFLIGDGTGVGKGRESMGVIMSHWHRSGTRRALIVSTGSLATDVRRDFDDCRIAEAFPGTKFIDASKALPAAGEVGTRAVIFTTYSQIRSPRKGYKPYLELIKASGDSGAGTLVLDEVHKGTGDRTTVTYGDRAAGAGGRRLAAAVHERHLRVRHRGPAPARAAPRARGREETCAFPSFDELKTALHSHKATGLELLTAQLSHEGLFLARCISYHGTRADHSPAPCPRSTRRSTLRAQIYADLWATGLYDPMYPKGYYVGSKVRFFKTLTLLAKLKDVVARVRSEIAEGRQVVVTVLGTAEAALKRADLDEVEQSGGVLRAPRRGDGHHPVRARQVQPDHEPGGRAGRDRRARGAALEPVRRARPVQARAPRARRGGAPRPVQRAARGTRPQRLAARSCPTTSVPAARRSSAAPARWQGLRRRSTGISLHDAQRRGWPPHARTMIGS